MTKPLRYMLVITGATLHSDNESDYDDDDEEIERGKKEKGRCEAEYIEWFALMERSTSAEGDAKKYHR